MIVDMVGGTFRMGLEEGGVFIPSLGEEGPLWAGR